MGDKDPNKCPVGSSGRFILFIPSCSDGSIPGLCLMDDKGQSHVYTRMTRVGSGPSQCLPAIINPETTPPRAGKTTLASARFISKQPVFPSSFTNPMLTKSFGGESAHRSIIDDIRIHAALGIVVQSDRRPLRDDSGYPLGQRVQWVRVIKSSIAVAFMSTTLDSVRIWRGAPR